MADETADPQGASRLSAGAGDAPSTGASPATGTDAPSAPHTSDVAAPAEPGLAGESSPGRGRRILVLVLIWGTTVLAVLGIFAVWANRQLLNPDNWANTSTRLLQNAEIRNATSNYLVQQLYAHVNVAGELKARLPPVLQPLAAPVAGALQNVAVSGAERALDSARVQALWKQANRAADQTFVSIVNGGKGAVKINGGQVTLNLAGIVADLTNQLGLPDLASKLPPSVANLEIIKSNQILKYVQDGAKALKGLALLLTIIVPLLYALAIFLARGRRRRALMTVGIAIVAAGVIAFAIRAIVDSAVVNWLVKVDANKPAADQVMSIATSMLTEIAGAFVIVGVPLIVAAWFAGPARLAVRGRRAIAPFLRDQPWATFGIVAFVMVLIFIWGPIPATHRPAGIIVFLALALLGTEVLRRQTAAEFPGTRVPEAVASATASE